MYAARDVARFAMGASPGLDLGWSRISPNWMAIRSGLVFSDPSPGMCTPAATSLASSALASMEFKPKWDAARCCSSGLCAPNVLPHTRHRTLPN